MNYYEIALTISVVALLAIVYHLQKQIDLLWGVVKQQVIMNQSFTDWNVSLADSLEKTINYSLKLEEHLGKQNKELYIQIQETKDDVLQVFNTLNGNK